MILERNPFRIARGREGRGGENEESILLQVSPGK
jgi:hypothetical protein